MIISYIIPTENKSLCLTRHLPVPISPSRACLSCMVRPYEVGITGPAREKMWGRLVIAARHMINTKEEDHNQE
ncbi:hypothetical protein CLV97_111105 [Planifilum fimeticola]|jgi:hemoglobin|uniref:Uncharacterized protein n=1 Tax=Planifilum fimeticola TaxID=201975 RepID=A0A2T0LF50_9BACL|nr:hypothetical protein CLV97_111105 [Planifilum fimeticola]